MLSQSPSAIEVAEDGSGRVSDLASRIPIPRPGRGLLVPAAVIAAMAVVTIAAVWPRLQVRIPVSVTTVALVPPAVDAPGAQPVAVDASTIATGGADEATESVELLPVPPAGADPDFQAGGWVESDPLTLRVSALRSGIVDEVMVLDGQQVTAGQLLATLVDDDARLDLAEADAAFGRAEAEVTAAAAALERAQTDWDHPLDLDQRVHHTRHLLEQREAELHELAAQVAAAVAHLAELQDQAQRAANTDGEIAEQERVQAQLRVDTQVARVAALRARQPIVEALRLHAHASLTNAVESLRLRTADKQALEVARARHQQAQAGLVQAQVRRDRAQLAVDRCQITSPVDGVIKELYAFPGRKQMLGSDMPTSVAIADVYRSEQIQVRVDVPLVDAGRLRVGMPCRIESELLPGVQWTGHVTRIVGEADIQRNTLQAKVRVHDPDPRLRPDVLMRVAFFEQRSQGGQDTTSNQGQRSDTGGWQLYVPSQALVDSDPDQATAFAFVVVGDQRQLERRRLSLGPDRRGDWHLVQAGLRPGDQVVNQPTQKLSDGVRVHIVSQEVNR